MKILDSKGKAPLDEPDLFTDNTGLYDIKDAEYLKCTVSTGKPMAVGEEYKVAIKFYCGYALTPLAVPVKQCLK